MSRFATAATVGALLCLTGCGKGKPAPDKATSETPAPTTAQATNHTAAPSAAGQATRPELAPDGYPTGQSSPEGVACDFARSFLQCDSALFRRCVVPNCGGEEAQRALDRFVNDTAAEIDAAKAMTPEQRGGPQAFKACYAARHMTNDGPASFAYAVLRYDDVMFVDVVMTMLDEPDYLCRTLVLESSDGTWYVHPDPSSVPLLDDGLSDESDSTVTFEQAYGIPSKSPPSG